MRTKFYSIILLCGLVLGLVACREEPTGEQVNFTVRVTPDEIQKNLVGANGDTWQAVNLAYSVYKHGEAVPYINETTTFDASNTATIIVKVAAGEFYDFVFFAYADDAPYAYDPATKSVSTTYTDTYDGNLEKLDAFYAFRTWEVKNNFTASVALKRAVAQLNLLTADADYNACAAAYYTPGYTTMKINNVYRSFDLKDGLAIGEPSEITFELGDINNVINDDSNPIAGYKWLAMNYFFTNESVVDVDVTIHDGAQTAKRDLSVYNVPVQRNYRTNIYGDLLMSNGEIKVVKDGNWDGEFNNAIVVETEQEFLDALTDGGNIVLKNDISMTDYLRLKEDSEVDLMGHTLTLSNIAIAYPNKSVEFKNGTIESTITTTSYDFQVYNGSSIVLDGVDYTSPERTTTGGKRIIAYPTEDANFDLVVKNSNIEGYRFFRDRNASNGGTIVVEDCTFNGGSAMIDAAGTYDVTIKNTTIKSEEGYTLYFAKNSTVTIDNCDLESGNREGILLQETMNHLTVSNTTIKAATFGIGTNAGVTGTPVVTLNNVNIESEHTGILFNVPGTLELNNCEVIGKLQAIVARGGTHTYNNTIITMNAVEDFGNVYMTSEWATGNDVPSAAITFGNRHSVYQYPTSVTMTGCKVNVVGTYANSYPAVYGYANQGDGLGATFNYDAATKFIGGTGLYYQSANITVNGTAITSPMHCDNAGNVIE